MISRRIAFWAGLVPVTTLVTVACGSADRAPVDAGPRTIAGVGFLTPESVLHDAVGDVYLVSNINGSPLEKDDNGFISRVSPDGQVLGLKWIDGDAADVTLSAPKGMAIHGDTLFVTDIDEIRLFHRESGAPLGSRAVAGVVFLNDLAVGPDGRVYFTETGFKAGPAGFEPSGTDAVYRFGPGATVETVRKGADLGAPNGLAVDTTGVVVVTFGSGEVYHLTDTDRHPLPKLPAGQLDGVERLPDGSLLISSWGGSAVYRLDPRGQVSVVVDSVEAPADIGFDSKRGRVLIPLFNANRIEIRPVGAPPTG